MGSRQPLGPPLRAHQEAVKSVAFSPDGQTLVSGSWDSTVILWDVGSRQPLGPPLQGHKSIVNSVAFSPNGQILASGSWDKAILLWDVFLPSWQEHACRIANRNLSREEWQQYLGDLPYRKTCPNLPEPEAVKRED
jgi:WD40 repeat protein